MYNLYISLYIYIEEKKRKILVNIDKKNQDWQIWGFLTGCEKDVPGNSRQLFKTPFAKYIWCTVPDTKHWTEEREVKLESNYESFMEWYTE